MRNTKKLERDRKKTKVRKLHKDRKCWGMLLVLTGNATPLPESPWYELESYEALDVYTGTRPYGKIKNDFADLIRELNIPMIEIIEYRALKFEILAHLPTGYDQGKMYTFLLGTANGYLERFRGFPLKIQPTLSIASADTVDEIADKALYL